MLSYLDTVIVVYAVESNPADQQRALNHLAALEQAGHRFAISDLTHTECLVPVFGPGGGQRLSDFFRFFHGPNLRTLGLTAATYARASAIRGGYNYLAIPPAPPRRYGLADALHLAAAIESGCDEFLTNDNQLVNFLDVTIEGGKRTKKDRVPSNRRGAGLRRRIARKQGRCRIEVRPRGTRGARLSCVLREANSPTG